MHDHPYSYKLGHAMAAIALLTLLAFHRPAEASELKAADVAAAVSEYRQAHERQILEEFFDLLRIPNYSENRDDIMRNANHIVGMLEKRGVKAQVLEASKGAPAIYGELMVPGAETTVLFYAHYDGQPVVPENWSSSPYEPVLRTGYLARGGKDVAFDDVTFPIDSEIRIFARSTSDDKAPVIGILTALDALKAAGIDPSINIKFFFEGEEERGSPNLDVMLAEFGHLLEADVLLFCDGPVHQTGRKKLSFGVRGPIGFDVTVYGPDRPLHSGHYGNYAPNPIAMLAHLISSMRDEDSRILVDGIYDEVVPPTKAELDAIANLPRIDDQLRHELALGRRESADLRYQEALLWPALNLKGIRAGEVGSKSRNTIVTSATAAFGYRMVPNQTPELLKKLTEDHIRGQGYHIVYDDPDAETRRKYPKVAKVTWTSYGYGAVRTPVDDPSSQAVISIMKDMGYDDLILIPSSGGSLPIWYFGEALDLPLIMLSIANYDNNQHAENENIRIRNLWEGIEIYGAIIATYGHYFDR